MKKKQQSQKEEKQGKEKKQKRERRQYGLVKRLAGSQFVTPDGKVFDMRYKAYRHLDDLAKARPELLQRNPRRIPGQSIELFTTYGVKPMLDLPLIHFHLSDLSGAKVLGIEMATTLPLPHGKSSLYAWVRQWMSNSTPPPPTPVKDEKRDPVVVVRVEEDVFRAPTTLALSKTEQPLDVQTPSVSVETLLATHLSVWRQTRASWAAHTRAQIEAAPLPEFTTFSTS